MQTRKGLINVELLQGEVTMLQAAIAFFVLALLSMILGANGIAGVSMEIGRTLLWIFLILAVVSFVANLLTGRGRHGSDRSNVE
jgi:uncharacterized membrane protein YtjA (UPF0391 family)